MFKDISVSNTIMEEFKKGELRRGVRLANSFLNIEKKAKFLHHIFDFLLCFFLAPGCITVRSRLFIEP